MGLHRPIGHGESVGHLAGALAQPLKALFRCQRCVNGNELIEVRQPFGGGKALQPLLAGRMIALIEHTEQLGLTGDLVADDIAH